MWTCDDETPLASPTLADAPRLEVLRAPSRASHSSYYYKTLNEQRKYRVVEDQDERDYGWGGNAGAYRQASPVSRTPFHHQTSVDAGTAYSGISIRALVDPRDVIPSPSEDGTAPAMKESRRSCLHSALRRIMAWLFQRDSSHRDYSDPACRERNATKELQATRDFQEGMLMKRRDRGSIMIEKDTGIARIPLYAAPQSTQIADAPALSSFAPIAPLGSDAPAKALAKAAATVTIDGRVLEIKKQKAFNRGGGRYSAFVKSSEMSVQLPSPTIALPHAEKQDSMRVAEIAATDEI